MKTISSLIKIILMFGLCLLWSFPAQADDYKQIHEVLKDITPHNGTFYEWPLEEGPIRKLKFLQNEEGKPFILNAGARIMFLGPPGAFIFVVTKGEQRIIKVLPHENTLDNIKKGTCVYHEFEKRSLLYLGYYYPEKYTGAPYWCPPNKQIYLYVLKPSFFNDQKETVKPDSNDDAEPVPLSKPFEIRPLVNKSGWLHVAGVIGSLLFLGVMVSGFKFVDKFELKYVRERKEYNSMRSLYKDGVKKFLCRHCGAELKIKGRFECRLGHIPETDRYIFQKCNVWQDGKKCQDIFEYMRCNHCGKELSLDKENYNEEEIANRGKDYILRTAPIKKRIIPLYMIAFFAFIFPQIYFADLWSGNRLFELSMYQEIYGWITYQLIFNPSIYYFAACLIIGGLIVAYTIFMTDDVIVRNPYDRKV